MVYPRRGLLRLREELPEQMKLESMLADGFELNPNLYEAGVGAIVKVEICEEIIQNENVVLTAFKGKELRGWSEAATKINEELGYQYFLTAYGEGNDQFEYALIDTVTKERIALSGTLAFQKNGLEGTPTEPLLILPSEKIDCDQYKTVTISTAPISSSLVYPNPFRNNLRVTVPNDLGEKVNITLLDSYGRILHQEIAVEGSVLNWSRVIGTKDVANGVYYIRFSTDNGSKIEKVVRY